MGMRLVAGRDFEWRDGPDAPPVAIISQQLARHFVGDPVGQRFTLGQDDVREVIGVAADSRYARVTDAPREVVYLPFFAQVSPRYVPDLRDQVRGHDGRCGAGGGRRRGARRLVAGALPHQDARGRDPGFAGARADAGGTHDVLRGVRLAAGWHRALRPADLHRHAADAGVRLAHGARGVTRRHSPGRVARERGHRGSWACLPAWRSRSSRYASFGRNCTASRRSIR